MGVMTATVDYNGPMGNKRLTMGKMTFSASYANPGGDTFTLRNLGLTQELTKLILIPTSNSGALIAEADGPNLKVMLFNKTAAGTTEVPASQVDNASDQSLISFDYLAIGT